MVAARNAEELATALRVLPDDVTAVFLARTELNRARAVQQEAAIEPAHRHWPLTPPGRLQPDLADSRLTRNVSLAVTGALKITSL